MEAISFTQKYSSLFNAKSVNPLAEVTDIQDKELTVTQHGQCWHSRMACWIKDSTRSLFSPLRKNTANTAWEQLSRDLNGDTSIGEDGKKRAQAKIQRWQKKGVPLRKLHVRQLLRQIGEDFNPPIVGASVKGTLFPKKPRDRAHEGLPLESRLPEDGEQVIMLIVGSAQTEISDSLTPKLEIPKLDAVAQEFVTHGRNWVPANVNEAVVELLDKNGIRTTAEFGKFDNTKPMHKQIPPLAYEVMLKFFKITKESAGKGEEPSSMTTEEFKDNFKKAFSEVIDEKKSWFERADDGWDPTK